MREAAGSVEFVVLPFACTNEGKGAPLAMGIQRWWAQELAVLGTKAAAPVFTALAEQDGKKVPALMVFREAWTDERALEGIGRFGNARSGLAVDLSVADNQLSYSARLVRKAGDNLEEVKKWSFDGKPEQLAEAVLDVLRGVAEHHDKSVEHKSWSDAFSTSDHQALLSFLVGLGNLSALQGRCVPTTADQLLSPFMDAINRDPKMDPAMQGLHMMVDILVNQPTDQSAIPLSLQALNLAAQKRQTDQSAYHHLGTLFRRLGDMGSAVQALNQAFNIDPTDASVANTFVETLRGAGDHANALKVAQFSAERGNEHPVLMAHLGSLMIEHDQFDEAEPFLRRAVDEGQVPSAYGDLANVLWDRSSGTDDSGDTEDRQEALALLTTAVEQGKIAKSALDMLLDLHEDEKLEQATMLLLKAGDKYDKSPTILRYVATMYLEGDDHSKARPYLDKILAVQRRSLDDDAFARLWIADP